MAHSQQIVDDIRGFLQSTDQTLTDAVRQAMKTEQSRTSMGELRSIRIKGSDLGRGKSGRENESRPPEWQASWRLDQISQCPFSQLRFWQ